MDRGAWQATTLAGLLRVVSDLATKPQQCALTIKHLKLCTDLCYCCILYIKDQWNQSCFFNNNYY